MEPYRPLSACALLDGVTELEKFFNNYKSDVISTIRGTASANSRSPSPAASGRPYSRNSERSFFTNNDNINNVDVMSASTNTVTARAMYHSQVENQALTQKMFGDEHGVLDVIHHLFTRHGTSHNLFDAIEHLNLLIPNWHEPRKKDDGTLMETPEMRIYAMRTTASTSIPMRTTTAGGPTPGGLPDMNPT